MAQYTKGQSGNPAGKPRGAKDKRTELRQLLQPHAGALINTVVAKALAGDMAAMRLCLDRIVPALKPTSEPVSLTMPATGTLSDQAAAVFSAVVAGEITTEEAAALAGVLASTARTQESDKKINQFEELKRLISSL